MTAERAEVVAVERPGRQGAFWAASGTHAKRGAGLALFLGLLGVYGSW